jgi:fibronectin type 3 domain-containing protein
MKIHLRLHHLIIALLLFSLTTLTGCGGSDNDNPAPTAGVSRGTITAMGSIFVNGVEFDTTNAAVTMDDPSDIALDVGMVVTVDAIFEDATHGIANRVRFSDNLKGPIAEFNSSARTLLVLGQTVTFDNRTVFDDFDEEGTAGVLPGQMVQISGYSDPNGTIHATRIERHLPDWTQTEIVEIKGTIDTMPSPTLFTIGGLTVDASAVTLPAGIGVGSSVKVEGTLAAFTSTTLHATSVSRFRGGLEDREEGRNHVEVEGYVQNLSGNTFLVNGTLVNAGTLSPAGLANGVEVEVEGVLVNGVLIAQEIEIESDTPPPPVTVPGAPVASAVGGFGQVTVSWGNVSTATSYNLYWSMTTGVTPANGSKIAGVTSPFTHTGRNASTTYYYVVTAVNGVGEGLPSAQVSATTLAAPTVPAAPIGVSAVGGDLQVTVSWAAVSSATSYNLYWSPTSGVTPATGTLIAGVSSPHAHTGLNAATTYYYVVTAVNAVGESAPSAQVSATTAAIALPAPPANVAAVGGNALVTITWNSVVGATSYNLYWSTTPGVTPLTGTLLANVASPYLHTGRAASTTYYYVVTAVNANGEGNPSAQASAMTNAAPMPPAAPTGVTAVGGTNQVTVSWTAVAGATAYDLYWSLTTGVTPTNGTLIANVTSPYTQMGLAASTTYYYVVTARNAAGTSPASAQASATTAAPAIDGALLYGTYCGCHGVLANSNVRGTSAALTQSAINTNRGGMGFLTFLTPAQVQAIANALNF